MRSVKKSILIGIAGWKWHFEKECQVSLENFLLAAVTVVLALFPGVFSLCAQMRGPILANIVNFLRKHKHWHAASASHSCLIFTCCKKGKYSIFHSCVILTMWGCWEAMPCLQKCFKFTIPCSKYSYIHWVCASHQKRIRGCPGSWQRDITRLIERLFTFCSGEGEARPGGKN